MAAGRLLQALAAAGRARSAAAAMGHRRCPLPRQSLGALLSLGAPRTVRQPFSTNAVEGDGATIAGGNNSRFKIDDNNAQKGTAYGIGTGNTGEEAEDADEISVGGEIAAGTGNTGMAEMAEAFGVGAGNPTDDAEEEGPGDIKEGKSGDGVGVDDVTARASTADGAVEGDGAAIAGGNNSRFKIAYADVQKGTAYGIWNTGEEAEDADELSVGGEIAAGTGNTGMAEMAVKLEAFGVGAGDPTGYAEEEGPGDIKEGKSSDRVGVDDATARASTGDGCFYDDARLTAVLEKFVAEKTVVSAVYVPGLTENLESERIKHSKERLHSDLRHLMITVLAVLLELLAVAYLLTEGEDKEGDKEKDDEVVDDDKKMIH